MAAMVYPLAAARDYNSINRGGDDAW